MFYVVRHLQDMAMKFGLTGPSQINERFPDFFMKFFVNMGSEAETRSA
jgi:hypothetical protein